MPHITKKKSGSPRKVVDLEPKKDLKGGRSSAIAPSESDATSEVPKSLHEFLKRDSVAIRFSSAKS
ncbi:MAG: hypothetical protein DLM52_05585 [Chthoniobacterales bacterium]|nr:MAG: hypothetical protein DLM52_05585 [Chthoniobacterales bacterium]